MKSFFTKLAYALTFSAPAFAFAQQSPFLGPVKQLLGDLEYFISFLNKLLPGLAVIVFFALIIMYIYRRMTGKESGFSSASNIFAALVALAVLFTVYGLINLLASLFGLGTNKDRTITAPSLPQVGGIRGGGYYNSGTQNI